MTYSELRNKAVSALKDTNKSNPKNSKIAFHLYSEIIDCIDQKKFYEPRRFNTKVKFFTIKHENGTFVIQTHHRYNVSRYYCLKNVKLNDEVQGFTRAMELIGLKVEKVTFGDEYDVYFLVQ